MIVNIVYGSFHLIGCSFLFSLYNGSIFEMENNIKEHFLSLQLFQMIETV